MKDVDGSLEPPPDFGPTRFLPVFLLIIIIIQVKACGKAGKKSLATVWRPPEDKQERERERESFAWASSVRERQHVCFAVLVFTYLLMSSCTLIASNPPARLLLLLFLPLIIYKWLFYENNSFDGNGETTEQMITSSIFI